MKKFKILGMFVGVVLLAVSAATTFAWFTSTSGPMDLIVNTARIDVSVATVTTDMNIHNKLPGELFGLEAWGFQNNSSRESVVEFTLSATAIKNNDGEELDRSAMLRELLDASAVLNVAAVDNFVYEDKETGKLYIWLDGVGQLDGVAQLDGEAFSFSMTVPPALGGNNIEEGVKQDDMNEEQAAAITVSCTAVAVQGTYEAVSDVFGKEIADKFLDEGYFG